MLFNEPKLLKFFIRRNVHFGRDGVSVLFNEPKLLKLNFLKTIRSDTCVSVLFNEPKLLKCNRLLIHAALGISFSALQRAEIAEMAQYETEAVTLSGFSALQRAEIAEISTTSANANARTAFQCSSTSRNC